MTRSSFPPRIRRCALVGLKKKQICRRILIFWGWGSKLGTRARCLRITTAEKIYDANFRRCALGCWIKQLTRLLFQIVQKVKLRIMYGIWWLSPVKDLLASTQSSGHCRWMSEAYRHTVWSRHGQIGARPPRRRALRTTFSNNGVLYSPIGNSYSRSWSTFDKIKKWYFIFESQFLNFACSKYLCFTPLNFDATGFEEREAQRLRMNNPAENINIRKKCDTNLRLLWFFNYFYEIKL